MVNSFQNILLDGLFPNSCILCRLPSHGPFPLCQACRAELAPNISACRRCAVPLPLLSAHNCLCGQCLQQPPPFKVVRAPWLYSEYMAFLIQRWKFHRERRLTGLFADLYLEREPAPADIDLLVPIPLHWRRQWQRGYNQAELFTKTLRRQHPDLRAVALDTRLLGRTRATRAQSRMDAQERKRNLCGAFTVRRPCDNLRIAVVDDVLTTGATATAAANTLLDAGAASVEIWCLARTPAPGA